MANLISCHECTEMNPYAELGLLSEASLTSCSPQPDEARAQLKPVIDRRRPPGSAGLGRRGALWEAKNAGPLWRFATGAGGWRGGWLRLLEKGGSGSAVLCLTSQEASQSTLEPGEC